ncbi:MAG TPA: VWA domain-containing protein [Lachnospiraceae bacterium]|nr:VWA domain-containing protein [Lachnospiraceae bacterium]
MKKTNVVAILGIVFAVVIVLVLGILAIFKSSSKGKTVDTMLKHIKVYENTPTKASISLDDNTLYDELPEISKYPLAVNASADINIEIMTSPEKAGDTYEAWLIDVADKFNREKPTTKSGKTVALSVRPVTSGLAADYIISNKHTPQLFTPSNYLWGEYVNANGGSVTVLNERLVGNTAGILIDKNSEYKNFEDIIKAVQDGKINIGYTNPQTSSTGMNLLLSILKMGDENMFSDAGIDSFKRFQQNIPFVAYNTMQMRDSAQKGTLDGMILEYQTYTNEPNINKLYNFIPFGIRHDNPLYLVNKDYLSEEEIEAAGIINDYLMSSDSQSIATKYGFNANDDYKSDAQFTGSEVNKALEMYKSNKDNGKDIIAVFVADCSGSMYGDPINQLKSSLSNGMQYINENNYVGLISYSDDVTIEVPIAKFDLNQKAFFQGGINGLTATGSTASYDAVVVAMKMIEEAKKSNPDAKAMIFLLSDGCQNVGYSMNTITPALTESKIPVYTISYTSDADTDAMKKLSEINEAATINADSEDIVYKIKSLFNSQM